MVFLVCRWERTREIHREVKLYSCGSWYYIMHLAIYAPPIQETWDSNTVFSLSQPCSRTASSNIDRVTDSPTTRKQCDAEHDTEIL